MLDELTPDLVERFAIEPERVAVGGISMGASAPTTSPASDRLEESGARVTMRTGPGGHESEYWSQNWDRYVRVYARALKECQEPRDRRG